MKFLAPIAILIITAILVPRNGHEVRVDLITEGQDTITVTNAVEWLPASPEAFEAEDGLAEAPGVMNRLLKL
jgi:hypothetical protein